MAHVDEHALEAVIHHRLSSKELGRIKKHVQGCRTCARRLEELRDRFTEVESVIPTTERSRVAPERDIVLMPSDPESTEPTGPWLDYTTLLWAAAIVLAVALGFVASRGHETETEAGVIPPPQSAFQDTGSVPAPGMAPVGPAAQPVPIEPPPQRVPRARPTSRAPASIKTPPPPAPIAGTMPSFEPISLEEAARRLEGPVRQVQGLAADHVEMGPANSVPGARPGRDLIRVVYRVGDDRLLLLDQQRDPQHQPERTTDTLLSTAPTGVSVAQWWDADGYWITLAGQVDQDSLRRLVQAIR